MATETAVLRLARSQTSTAGEVLGRAFYDDPAVIWGEPDTRRRLPKITWLMRTFARYATDHGGEVYTTHGTLEGAAIWLPPGEYPTPLLPTLRAGMILAPQKFGLKTFLRFTRLMSWIERLHKQHARGAHWYLEFLGVDPPRQGQGIGSALMQPVLARADTHGLPCYLETANARTVPLYQRHGFQLVDEGDVPKGGPRMWMMLRPPAGSSG